jgi:hypothetical protein
VSDRAGEEAEQTSSLYKQVAGEIAADREAVSSLRDTAKWIIGGIAIAAGGAVAGPALTSFGSLRLEPRLLVAGCGGLIGVAALAFLLWMAMDVLTPVTFGRSVLRKEEFKPILSRIKETLPPHYPQIEEIELNYEELAAEYAVETKEWKRAPHRDSTKLDEIGRNLGESALIIGFILSGVRFEHYLMKFSKLKRWLVGLGPLAVLSFWVFAWAANPPKEDAWSVVPLVEDVDVNRSDEQALRKAMSDPACVGRQISVLVLRERRSGSQDVVTVPRTGCAPIRLRLDHGRLAPDDTIIQPAS